MSALLHREEFRNLASLSTTRLRTDVASALSPKTIFAKTFCFVNMQSAYGNNADMLGKECFLKHVSSVLDLGRE